MLDLQEPWVNDAVVIGGASAVLSPIIQWGHTILQSKPQVQHAVMMNSLLSTITKVKEVLLQSQQAHQMLWYCCCILVWTPKAH